MTAFRAQTTAAPVPAPLLVDQAVFTNDVPTGHGFGNTVAVHGNTAVVGVEGGDPFASVHVFEHTGTSWKRLGRLSDSRANIFDGFGYSVAVNGDTIVVGDPQQNNWTGAAYVYTRNSGPGLNAWNLLDNNTTASGPSYRVSLVATQHTALLSNSWRYRATARMVHSLGGGVCMYFSYGNTTNRFLFFLLHNANGDLVAELPGATPAQHVLTTNGAGADDYHLHELEFNPATRRAAYRFDGRVITNWTGQALAGADGVRWGAGSTPGVGSINVHQVRFEMTDSGTVLASYDAGTPANPPANIDPLAQGWLPLVAPGAANTSRGPLTPDVATLWMEQARVTAFDGSPDDQFGNSIAISGDTMVVGAWDHILSAGAAYVFVRETTNWTLQHKLTPSPWVTFGRFGESVAIEGDTIVVGRPFTFTEVQPPGDAFVFVRSGPNWMQQGVLVAPGNEGGNGFGRAVAISGNRIAIGAPGSAQGGAGGAVYVSERSGGSWGTPVKLLPSPLSAGEAFGDSVAIGGDTVVVGGRYQRASYVFGPRAGGWLQTARRVYTGGAGLNVDDVAIDGETIVVGVSGTGGTGIAGGAVYVQAPDYANAGTVAGFANQLLYYPSAAATGPLARNLAAFRYKHLLYGQSNSQIRARFENMASLYGPAERERAGEAEAVVMRGLGMNPGNATLGGLLLDICYDRTVAETILAKDLTARLERASMNPPTNGFVIDNELALYPQVLAASRFALQCYFDLLKRELIIPTPAGTRTRWATSVLGFSSEWAPQDPSWNAIQALGQPDTYPDHGDLQTAWASATADDQREFLELGYLNPAPINSVSIYETYYPGAVDKVSVRNANTGQWQEAWSGTAAPAGSTARVFTVTFPLTTFPVDAVRLDINSTNVPDWNEIDAVSVTAVPVVDATFGYRLFQQLVPGRGLLPATYTNAGGNFLVTTNAAALTNGMLYTGYKDLVLLFDLLREYGVNAATYARLLIARDDPGDRPAAQALLTEAQQFVVLQGSLLKNQFPALPPNGDRSGIAQSIAGWNAALGDLEHVGALLQGNVNVLGFSDDFLMLVQKFQGQNPELYDSFNSLKDWLDPDASSRHLRYAVDRLAIARAVYDTFRGFEDDLLEQFDQSTVSYDFRLFEIVGARPGEAAYETPQNNAGSEIQQQMQSIDVARIRIARNQTEIGNLYQRIQIELTKAADLQAVAIRYGNKQAQLTEEIGHINTAQAAAQAYADAFSIEKLNPVNIFFSSVNAGVQTGGELAKSQKEAQKERLAAAEQVEIIGIEAQATVKQLWLDMRTAVLDSQEAVLLMRQEVGRLAALLREKADLERRLSDRDTSLASRYFADPVHRLRASYEAQMARYAFDEAQRWLFYMVRALEYKWNQPFSHFLDGRSWDGRSIFKLRNADELFAFYRAMDDYDGELEGTRIKEQFFDWFSVREDFFGYRLRDDNGQLLSYPDPISGQSVDALTAFRSRLRQALDVQSQIRLSFHTVRQIPGGTFFRSARYLPNGEVDPAQRGLYLDKIYWMKIRLPGRHNPNRNRTFVTGSLTQAGTSYLRNEVPGYFDPQRPDRLVDEMTPYGTRFWFLSNARTNHLPGITSLPPRWMFREGLSHPAAQMWLTDEPRQNGVPGDPDPQPEVQQIDAFKERSVAASDWRLIIPTRDLGTTILSIDEMDDVEIYFYHYAVIRP